MAITQEKIWKIADELDAAGKKPTLAAIRKELNGGSYTTISEAMKEWRAKQANDAVVSKEPAPEIVLERLSEVGGEVWALALEKANDRFSSDREALELEKQDMEASWHEATDLADQLTSDLEESKTVVANQLQQLQELQEQKEQLQAQVLLSNERAVTAETSCKEMQLRLQDLRSELSQAHEDAKASRNALSVSQNELKDALNSHKQELSKLAQEHKQELAQQSKAHQDELDRVEEVHSSQLSQLAEEHKQELAQQSKAHQDELDRVEEVHSSQLSQLAEEHKQELAQQSKGYEQDLKHQSELAAQRITSLEVDISELQTERNKALEAVTIAKEEAANIRGQIKGLETALTSRN
ncbi:DNA-binding protein [Vibrio parahaemolyticus]|uniref:DNA-binding protein n=3 Tax=Vibrio TaxID=662 RepID=UPI001122C98B|nr:DNA-binding protein [Vibrio parahaemolyticus]MDG2676332.1 DNA-binding protein [Vibrio parahaemolyticus]TOA86324.1 KfrA protein [Vibrio parahaemolyticus]HBH7899513.1 DNA-binding protein [Vibrio parahaemolyticus]